MQEKITPCGMVCGECVYYGKSCEGCRAQGGTPFWCSFTGEERCRIYVCCEGKGYADCGQCNKLPCENFMDEDPAQTAEWSKASLAKQLERLTRGNG